MRSRATVCSVVFLCLGAVAAGPPPAFAAANPHNVSACASCHPVLPRFGVDTGRDVSFTTSADDPGLCAPCHPPETQLHPVLVAAGSGPAGARVSFNLPPGSSAAFSGKVVCTSCHYVHASDTAYSLLRGFPGSPDPRLFTSVSMFCQECHGENLAARSPHAAGERLCASCHSSRPRQERDPGERPSFGERCRLCHREVRIAHYERANPFEKPPTACAGCHDRHALAGDSPGLLSGEYLAAAADSEVISPHFRRGLCFACHENLDDYTLRSEDVNALCDRCHASGRIRPNIHPLRQVPERITVPAGWPLADGALTCLTCHDQGHEDQERLPMMLHGGPYAKPRDVCRHCHDGRDLEASRIHAEINEGRSCEMCHRARPRPGVDTAKTVTLIADPDLLCMRCHDAAASDGRVHHTGVLGREVEPGHLPRTLPLFKGRIICATCHNPHMLEATGMRLREQLDTTELCIGCHGS